MLQSEKKIMIFHFKNEVHMASPIRLSDELLKVAEKHGKSNFRSAPKQIELWAHIGQEVESNMTPADLAALANGEVEIRIIRKESPPVGMDDVFNAIDEDRRTGVLSEKVVQSKIWYEESKEHPHLLIRVDSGKRELGLFENGVFTVCDPTNLKKSGIGKY